MPGLGQLLNKRYVKGIFFVFLEFIINVQARFNEAILFSFNGETQLAIEHTNYQWLMFYPCLYFFAMWDAFKDAGGGKKSYAFLPFVFSAYFVTVGLIYSTTYRVFGVLLGPVWLPMLCVIPGAAAGLLLQKLLLAASMTKLSN